MTFRLALSPSAIEDIRIGIGWYDSQLPGLGDKFEQTINATFLKIKRQPLAASFAYDSVRYKVVGKFPYVILYETVNSTIFILRVFNTHMRSNKK